MTDHLTDRIDRIKASVSAGAARAKREYDESTIGKVHKEVTAWAVFWTQFVRGWHWFYSWIVAPVMRPLFRLARGDERLKILTEAITTPKAAAGDQQQDDDPKPDKEADVFAYLAWQERRLRPCGRKPIRKMTTRVWVKKERTQYDHAHAFTSYVYVGDNWPKDKADCQRLANEQVAAVGYDDIWNNDVYPSVKTRGKVSWFSTWDGESYDDAFFCSNTCAISFACGVAKHTTFATDAYRAAVKAHQQPAKTGADQ